MNLVALAVLLHYRKLILLSEMRWGELAKALVTAAIAGVLSFEVAKIVPLSSGSGNGSRGADLLRLGMITVTWAAAVAAGLWLLRSELPGDLRRRKVTAYPGVAEGQSKEILGAGREP
jgi:hypothetical protein